MSALKDKNLSPEQQKEIMDKIKQLFEVRNTLATGLDRIVLA